MRKMEEKILTDQEKFAKTKEQAKELLDSGFYYAAADLYERILTEDGNDEEVFE